MAEQVASTFNAYDAAFSGGVQVATGDVNGDGIEDIVTGAGPERRAARQSVRRQDRHAARQFLAYDSGFTGGMFVAVGDINRDGFGDIITGTGVGGGPHVKVFSGVNNSLMRGFFAYDNAFRGGVRVASGDVNSDGYAEIVTTPGPGGGPHVKIYDGAPASYRNSSSPTMQRSPAASTSPSATSTATIARISSPAR